MPTYEYACKACGERLEVVQSFSDAPLKECPACGGELRKVFSPVGIAFKGSGFYKNDSRSKSSSTTPAASGDSKSSSSESSSSTTPAKNDSSSSSSKSETKPSSPSSSSSAAAS